MTEDLTTKYKLKLYTDRYNKKQKSLYINSFVLRIVLILIFVVALFLLSIFILPLATPLLLKSSVMADALVIMIISIVLGCIISLIVLFFLKKTVWNKHKQRNLNKTNSEFKQNTYKKGALLSRYLNVLTLFKDILGFMGSIFFAPIQKPDLVALDNHKIEFGCWLIKRLSSETNNFLPYESVKEDYKNFSANWINKVISELSKINIINVSDVENKGKMIFLNLN